MCMTKGKGNRYLCANLDTLQNKNVDFKLLALYTSLYWQETFAEQCNCHLHSYHG